MEASLSDTHSSEGLQGVFSHADHPVERTKLGVELKVGHRPHAVAIVSARRIVEGLCYHRLSDGCYDLCPGCSCVGHNVK